MRIALATQHSTGDFIPLALMYLKAALVGRRCAGPDEVAILEFPDGSTPDAIADAVVATGVPCARTCP